MVKPALEERALHSRAFYLQDASFSEPVPTYPDKEKTFRAQGESSRLKANRHGFSLSP